MHAGLLTESVDDGVPVVLPLGRPPPQDVGAAAVPVWVRRLHVGAPARPLLADDLRKEIRRSQLVRYPNPPYVLQIPAQKQPKTKKSRFHKYHFILDTGNYQYYE